ncbi:hypothetical protein ABPG72_021635 [Tetrahymena utriculariae]
MSSKEIDYFQSIKLSMSKALSEDVRRVSTNNFTEGIMSYGMQQIYRFHKWGTSCKTIDLKVDVPSFILGKDLTPQRVKLVKDKSRDLKDEGNQNKYRMLMLSNSSDIRVDNEPKQEEIISKETFQTQDAFEQEDYDDKDFQETENQMKEKSKQMLKIYQNTILFTYRKNFQPLLKNKTNIDLSKKLTTDAGWGCMIRAGQMIFAQAIKRHLKKTDYIEQHQLINIIIGFLEEEEGNEYIFNQQSESRCKQDKIHPYSIHQITSRAFNNYSIQPGQWYTPNQISIILRELHQRKKIKGTEDLKIAVHSSDKPIIFEKILQTLLGRKIKINFNCNHDNQLSRNSINQDQDESYEKIMSPDQQEIEDFSSECEESKDDQTDNLCCKDCFKTKNKLFLLLPCRLGLDEISETHIEIMKKLLSLNQSVGMIGGKPNKAHYFLGFIGNDLLYLDPHYIKESVRQEDLMNNLSSYFEEDIFKMPINQISTSLVFGFYFSEVDELNKFYKFLRQLEKEYQDDFFLVIEKQTPLYAMSNISEIKKLTKQKNNSQKENQYYTEMNQFENYDGSVGDDFEEDNDTNYDEYECQEDKQDEFDQSNNLEESENSQKLNQQTNYKNYSDTCGAEIQIEGQQKYEKLINELPKKSEIQNKQSEEELKNIALAQLQQQNQQISNQQKQTCI